MKSTTLITLMLSPLVGLSQVEAEMQTLLNYEPSAGNKALTLTEYYPSYNDASARGFREMVNYFWKGAEDGSITTYEMNPLLQIYFDKPEPPKTFNSRIHIRDTSYRENLENGEFVAVIQQFDRTPEDIVGVQIHEQWFYNQQNAHLYTKTYGMSFLFEVRDEMGGVRGVAPLFTVSFPQKGLQHPHRAEEMNRAFGLTHYDDEKHVQDADVVWAQDIAIKILFQNGDPQQIASSHIRYNSPLKRIHGLELPGLVYESVLKGQRKAYEDQGHTSAIPSADLESYFSVIDTAYVEDMETGDIVPVVMDHNRVQDVLYSDPYQVKFNYVFNYDPKKHTVTTNISTLGAGQFALREGLIPIYFWTDNGGK